MKQKSVLLMTTTLAAAALLAVGLIVPSPASANQTGDISGVGRFALPGECTAPIPNTYAVVMSGDLDGCTYVTVDSAVCSPSGAYIEEGHETFVDDTTGSTFMTIYKFEAKYADCSALAGEVFGRCQHPLVEGSGTGIFEGVTGRIDMKDDVTTGEFLYRGRLK